MHFAYNITLHVGVYLSRLSLVLVKWGSWDTWKLKVHGNNESKLQMMGLKKNPRRYSSIRLLAKYVWLTSRHQLDTVEDAHLTLNHVCTHSTMVSCSVHLVQVYTTNKLVFPHFLPPILILIWWICTDRNSISIPRSYHRWRDINIPRWWLCFVFIHWWI